MSSIEKAMAKLQPKGAPQEADSFAGGSSNKLIQEASEQAENTAVSDEEEALKVKSDSADTEVTTKHSDDKVETASSGVNEPAGNDIATRKASPQVADFHQEQAAKTVPDNRASAELAETKPEVSNRQSNYFEIDRNILAENGIVTLESDNRILREQFRAIKRKILRNAFGNLSETLHHPNLVIISSCNPHEGKTFSAINLAMNIALEKDKTVLLVDADIVRPSVASRIGMSPRPGLTEFLSGQVADISDVLYSTNIDNFKFIPAGTPHELSTELLASARMSTLTNELSSRYPDRIVLFDAPPMLGVNETHILANLVGQALLVVVESQTKIVDIQAATGQLDKEIAVGFVINKSQRHWNNQYGYGYGGYGYGHYQKD